MTVQDVLATAHGNPVSRAALCTATGLSDRAMRKEIEILRHGGVLIGNDQDGRGYYLLDPMSAAALKQMHKQMMRRATNILHQASQIKKQIKRIEEQTHDV